MLLNNLYNLVEIGVDEAGRGPLAGSVFAAAVILPVDFHDSRLNDSKKLTAKTRNILREVIEKEAIAFHVAEVSPQRIDDINILNATFEAMNAAILGADHAFDIALIDGNRFKTKGDFKYECIIKGDAKIASIAAASILAKTYRDEQMAHLYQIYPNYNWIKNAGYPTQEHRDAIAKHGLTEFHRKTFRWNRNRD